MDIFAGSSAVISDCGQYRYRLDRDSNSLIATAIIMVNPSTADADEDDHTIRKLMGFAARRSWGSIVVGNLFAYRSTDVRALADVDDPVGPENDRHLIAIAEHVDKVVYAWGPMSKLPRRLRARYLEVHGIFRMAGHRPDCIDGPAKDGHPKHPLMLSYDSKISPWEFV